MDSGQLHENVALAKRFRIQTTSKDKIATYEARRMVQSMDEEQLLFLVGEQASPNFDDDVDDPTEKDLALNVDHIF
ncbi:hypothetical protein Tco_0422227 [Tanacetum coccineum]